MPSTNEGFIANTIQGYFPFWEEGGVKIRDPKAVVEYLGFEKQEVATALRIPQSKVKYDRHMPEILRKSIQEWAVLLENVAIFFEGDLDKTVSWFNSPSYEFGGITPKDMIVFGRAKKLLLVIQCQRSGNIP